MNLELLYLEFKWFNLKCFLSVELTAFGSSRMKSRSRKSFLFDFSFRGIEIGEIKIVPEHVLVKCNHTSADSYVFCLL